MLQLPGIEDEKDAGGPEAGHGGQLMEKLAALPFTDMRLPQLVKGVHDQEMARHGGSCHQGP